MGNLEVIILESQAFYKLLEEVEKRAVQRKNASEYMTEEDVMKLFRITTKSHFSVFRTKIKIPCYKVPETRHFIYKRADIENFVNKFHVK